MRRTLLAAVAVAIAATFAGGATQAQACAGTPCDIVNQFCHCLG